MGFMMALPTFHQDDETELKFKETNSEKRERRWVQQSMQVLGLRRFLYALVDLFDEL
jgi:hypothetical protein